LTDPSPLDDNGRYIFDIYLIKRRILEDQHSCGGESPNRQPTEESRSELLDSKIIQHQFAQKRAGIPKSINSAGVALYAPVHLCVCHAKGSEQGVKQLAMRYVEGWINMHANGSPLTLGIVDAP
jgi:hypothetical protein